jgi:hypothetical protein
LFKIFEEFCISGSFPHFGSSPQAVVGVGGLIPPGFKFALNKSFVLWIFFQKLVT